MTIWARFGGDWQALSLHTGPLYVYYIELSNISIIYDISHVNKFMRQPFLWKCSYFCDFFFIYLFIFYNNLELWYLGICLHIKFF